VRLLAAIFIFLSAPFAFAAEEWETLANCKLSKVDYMDGDSFHVECGGKNYHFRLYFVDCPETDTRYPDRLREQAEHFGLTQEQSLAVGLKAKEFTMRMLRRPFTVLTRWYDARGASAQQRFYAIVLCDGKNLAEELVAAGFARAYGMRANFPDNTRSKDFVAGLTRLESRAMRARLGAWSKSDIETKVASSEPGDDPLLTSQAVQTEQIVEGTPRSETKDVIENNNEAFLESFIAQNQSALPSVAPNKPAEQIALPVSTSKSLININAATPAELDQLPKIGPALAERIIEGRPYSNIDDVRQVKGIGDKIFNEIAPLIATE